jgi:hypothetical protein
MIIYKLLRIWFTINDIQQKEFAKKHKIHANKIYEILKGIKKNIPIDFKNAFQKQFGFPVEDIYKHIKIEMESNTQEKGNESRIIKSKEGKKMEGKLYDVEGLSQERIDILQEMIDNWKTEDASKRKEERKKREYKTKSKKNNSV